MVMINHCINTDPFDCGIDRYIDVRAITRTRALHVVIAANQMYFLGGEIFPSPLICLCFLSHLRSI